MNTKDINLYWHKYKFFPYEKKFAVREIQSLLKPKKITEFKDHIQISESENEDSINDLVYFSHAETEKKLLTTTQFIFENGDSRVHKQKRQNTRYSVHGLHEYKGKFNPQVVRSLFNIYNIKEGNKILDPFCGSGTTLVESSHMSIEAYGTDINPLATFIANTKISALNISSEQILENKRELFNKFYTDRLEIGLDDEDLRIQYLKKWFPIDILIDIETLKLSSSKLPESIKNIFLVIISNLLRDYSLQEPSDLRIRRRFSPFPEISIINQLEVSIDNFISNLDEFQNSFKLIKTTNRAFNSDIIKSSRFDEFSVDNSFDFAVTSPPYATALPYIDTQRLSLVWLNLIPANEIKSLESDLIGSRDFKNKVDKDGWQEFLVSNSKSLPKEIHSFCINLNNKLKPTEGFRKKALPSLLYRYFYNMKLAFTEVHRLLKEEKYFCLIVGHNHTNIGGERNDIDTPKFLSYLGEQIGFKVHEIIELEAYQRYGLNSSNAVQKESLIVFKK